MMAAYKPTIAPNEYQAFMAVFEQTMAARDFDTDAFGAICIVGSAEEAARLDKDLYGNQEIGDIDLILIRAPEAALGRTLAATDRLIWTLDEKLGTEHGMTLSPTARMKRQVLNHFRTRTNDSHPLMLHRMVYSCLPSMRQIEPKGMLKATLDRSTTYFGDPHLLVENTPIGDSVANAHYVLEFFDLTSHATPQGWKGDREIVLAELEMAHDYLGKFWGIKAPLGDLTKATPEDVQNIVKTTRAEIDRLAA